MRAREVIAKTFNAEMRAWFIGQPFPDPNVSADAILSALESAGYVVIKLEPAEFVRRFERGKCFICGYNGQKYYQPQTHPCAKRFHEAQAMLQAKEAGE